LRRFASDGGKTDIGLFNTVKFISNAVFFIDESSDEFHPFGTAERSGFEPFGIGYYGDAGIEKGLVHAEGGVGVAHGDEYAGVHRYHQFVVDIFIDADLFYPAGADAFADDGRIDVLKAAQACYTIGCACEFGQGYM